MNHMGISDAIELTERAKAGDRYAGLLWDSMIYQIENASAPWRQYFTGRWTAFFWEAAWYITRTL